MDIALRIDDIGASSKKYEVYSKNRLGNIFFLKYLRRYKAWGPYRELTSSDWEDVFGLLEKHNARLTVGITASWVERDGTLVPFPEKYVLEADILKQASNSGLIEIANHGLTHCVVGQHLPKLISSNRKYHREFWDFMPRSTHFEHLEKSQEIFTDWLEKTPTTFVPPGNVYTSTTVDACAKFGIKRINSYRAVDHQNDIVDIVNEDNVNAFHDREIVLNGVNWFESLLCKLGTRGEDKEYVFVRDLK